MRKSHDKDRERAVTLICKSVVGAPIEVVRRLLCISIGHPPIIIHGDVCPRCGEEYQVPRPEWSFTGSGLGVHFSEMLTPTDLLLVPEETLKVILEYRQAQKAAKAAAV